MEYKGRIPPPDLDYLTCYAPQTVISRPKFTWTVIIPDLGELITYTNSLEAWLLMLSLTQYEGKKGVEIIYTEL